MIVKLPASLQDDLDWRRELDLARGHDKIVWEFDFAFQSLTDPAHFQTYSIALEQFVKSVLPLFQETTVGVCLYRGPLVDCDQELFMEWLVDAYADKQPLNLIGKMKKHYYAIFCADFLAGYLHRLGSYLPDDLPLYCFLELAPEMSPAQRAHLLSKERFGHIQTTLDPSKAPLGVCLPLEEEINARTLDQLDEVLEELEDRDFRIVTEALLTEEWAGLDQLIVIESALSHQGKRKLQGFCAAGGEVIYK